MGLRTEARRTTVAPVAAWRVGPAAYAQREGPHVSLSRPVGCDGAGRDAAPDRRRRDRGLRWRGHLVLETARPNAERPPEHRQRGRRARLLLPLRSDLVRRVRP